MLDAMIRGVGRYEPIDTGSLVGDLRAYVGAMGARMRFGSKTRDLIPHLISAAAVDPALEPALEEYAEVRTRPVRELFERALARGELPPGTDAAIAADMLLGALMHRRLIHGVAYEDEAAERLITYVLRAVSAGQ